MKKQFQSLTLIAVFCVCTTMAIFNLSSCKKEDAIPKSSEKAISGFSFASLSPAVTATISGNTISTTLPLGTDVTKLVPTITLSTKATVSPASGTAQNFSKDVTYTVTAEDGSTQIYTAKVPVNDIVEYKGLTVYANSTTRADLNQQNLVSFAEGKVYTLADGSKYDTKVDAIFFGSGGSGSSINLYFYSPAYAIKNQAAFTDIVKKWGTARSLFTHSLFYLWAGIDNTGIRIAEWNNITTSAIIQSYIKQKTSLSEDDFMFLTENNKLRNEKICGFQTKEGKYGFIKFNTGTKANGYLELTFDVKIQK